MDQSYLIKVHARFTDEPELLLRVQTFLDALIDRRSVHSLLILADKDFLGVFFEYVRAVGDGSACKHGRHPGSVAYMVGGALLGKHNF